ncbi:MAG: cytochrome c oxidase subunit II [Pseudomonadota bacterium]|nr:cytochrome c oxidase subunit II [Pseudomonadota bacterium]
MMGLKRLFTVLGCLFSGVAFAASKYNMPRGVTSISNEIYTLHMTIFWVCVAIGVIVFSVIIYSIFAFRKSKGAVAATFHSSLIVELIWTIIPFIILVVMAIPATRVLIYMNDDSEADMNIKVTGYQWKWKYDYLDEGISFFSNLATPQEQIENKKPKGEFYLLEVDKPLIVPIHKKVRFLVTANDVIHSWWVPELGIKRDAIPGFIHEAWARIDKPGTYRGQCAELCGQGHGFMPIVVIAKTEQDYAKWVAEQRGETIKQANAAQEVVPPLTKEELMINGKQLYLARCSVCHQPTGLGQPPTFPSMVGSKKTTGDVNTHIDTVLNGVPGTAMQAFAPQYNDKDQTKFGKAAGGIVQPKDIAARRK